MSAGAIEAGKAFVRILADDKALGEGLKKAQNKLKLFAASTGQLGRQLMAITGPILGLGAAGAKAFADFESQMAQVSTMLDDPAAFMGAFTEGIKNLSIQFGESTDTLAHGLYEILSASVAPAQAMDVLTAAVKAAKAGISDTATATSAIVTVMNAYGMRADQAGEISDWLFQVVKRGQSTFAELAPSIGNVATIAATAGVSLDELGAIFATITRAGVKTDEAITAISAIISTFLDPADEAAAIAKDLGINLSVSALQSEGLLAVFQKLGNLPPDVLAKLFPNIRALKGVLPALRNLEGFEEDMAALGAAAGSTEEAYKKLADTLAAKFGQVRQAIVLAAAEIGAALKVDLAAGAETIKQIGQYIADWIRNNQALIQTLGKTALVVAGVAGGLMALGAAANAAAWSLGGLALAGKATAASLTFLLAHPVVALLAAVAAAGVALTVAMDAAALSTLALADAQAGLLEKGDKKRQQDLDALNRLKALSEKQKLSSREMNEAAGIVDRLQSTYGDLGLSVDKATGKIYGVAGALKAVSAAMQSQAEESIRMAMLEAATNAELLSEEIRRLKKEWMSSWTKSEEVNKAIMQMERENTKAEALFRRLERLKHGDKAAITGTDEQPRTPGAPQTGDPLAAITQEKKAAEDAAKFKKGLDERMHQARLAMIENEYQRELEAIKAKHMAERAEAAKAGQNMAALMQVQQAEVAVIQTEHRRKSAEEQKKADEDRARNQRDLQEEIEDLTIKTQTDGLDQQLRLIEAQRRRALADAKALGTSVAAINKRYDLEAQLARKTTVDLPRISTAGTFSAAMASRMGGSVEDKQLEVLKNIAKTNQETRDSIRGIGRLR